MNYATYFFEYRIFFSETKQQIQPENLDPTITHSLLVIIVFIRHILRHILLIRNGDLFLIPKDHYDQINSTFPTHTQINAH